MKDVVLFARKFFAHGTDIASLVPSSPYLAEATVSPIDWSVTKTVLEVGAGTGPITAVLVSRAPKTCRLLILERDHDFVLVLQEKFASCENVEIIEGDVKNMVAILEAHGLQTVDAIVSGLGVAVFPREFQDLYFEQVKKVLSPGGIYTQITETPLALFFRNIYERYFRSVKFQTVLLNIPPAGVFICKELK